MTYVPFSMEVLTSGPFKLKIGPAVALKRLHYKYWFIAFFVFLMTDRETEG